jgi:hypothetical protein
VDFYNNLPESPGEYETRLSSVEIRTGKKIAARKGGGKGQLGLIFRGKEYHQGHNPVNNYLSEKNVEILRGGVLFQEFYQHNS